jgi:hypothetical protein
MLSRLLEAHEPIHIDAHDAGAKAAEMGDDGTNDLLVSNVIRVGELPCSWEFSAMRAVFFGPGVCHLVAL